MAQNVATTATRETGASRDGKFLTFYLGAEEYALEILKVHEIIGLMTITSVPRVPEFVRGVINLRGKVIPIVDLRRKFEMETVDDTDQTCVIVVQIRALRFGIVVDRVSEVVDLTAEEIEDAPEFGAAIDTGYILGMGKTGDRVRILLDIDRVLSVPELEGLTQSSSTGGQATGS